jgi:hypothetical protein
MLEVYFYIRSSFTTIPPSLNNEVVGTRDFDNASPYLLALHVEGPPRLHEAQRGCNYAGAWYCSEPFANTSVLQTSKPILQMIVLLANGISLQMVRNNTKTFNGSNFINTG